MACCLSIPAFKTGLFCSLPKQIGLISGTVSNCSYAAGVLKFNIGIQTFKILNLSNKPDWFSDGIQVEIDLFNQAIQQI